MKTGQRHSKKIKSLPLQSDQVEADQLASIRWVFNPVIRLDPGTESGGDLLQSKNVLARHIELHPGRGEYS